MDAGSTSTCAAESVDRARLQEWESRRKQHRPTDLGSTCRWTGSIKVRPGGPIRSRRGHEMDGGFQHRRKSRYGIRIKLSTGIAAAGFDFLLVMGIRDSLDAARDWTPELIQLFDAHHYTSGLSFLRPGTPSNNTPDAPSGFSSKDPGQETSYATEVRTRSIKRGDKSNADLLTTAFGLTNAQRIFANLPNATQKDQIDAQQMNTALWSATWGYFLLQMLGIGKPNESPLLDEDIAWARNHFIQFVRANGPLPALRIGRQPYGILPVTSLDAWKPRAGEETQSSRDIALAAFLRRLRNIWRRNF